MTACELHGRDNRTALTRFPIWIVNFLNVANVASEVKSARDNNEPVEARTSH
jgi:hypothetical protein